MGGKDCEEEVEGGCEEGVEEIGSLCVGGKDCEVDVEGGWEEGVEEIGSLLGRKGIQSWRF